MYQSPKKYYSYIASLSIIAIGVAWIIQESNNFQQKQAPAIDTNQSGGINRELLRQTEELEKKLQNNAGDLDLNIQMANNLFDIEQYDKAIVYYRKVLAIDPQLIAAQIDLSICYYNLHSYETAITEMKKALDIDPGHMKGLFNLGVIFYNSSKIDSAKIYWQQLLDLHPESKEADIARGIINNSTI